MNIKDYLPYYLGRRFWSPNSEGAIHSETITFIEAMIKEGIVVKPILRRIDSLTESEMIALLQSMVPGEMEEKPNPEDYDLDMFYNDGGNLVDSNIVVGAEYTCICYEGQIVIRKDGSIGMYDEDGKKETLINQPKAFHYLLSLGIDLFGLIAENLAIDADTIKHSNDTKNENS